MLILRNLTAQTGPVRGLDFELTQNSLLGSGGVGGEAYIFKDPSKSCTPTPGSRGTKLGEMTNVKWNQQVQYVERVVRATPSCGISVTCTRSLRSYTAVGRVDAPTVIVFSAAPGEFW